LQKKQKPRKGKLTLKTKNYCIEDNIFGIRELNLLFYLVARAKFTSATRKPTEEESA
jgi:hypothetical protein